MPQLGAALDFPKYYEKSALLAKKRKFPDTYHELQLIRSGFGGAEPPRR